MSTSVPPPPVRTSDAPKHGLPVTTYLWFALLCLGAVLPHVLGLSKPEAAVSTRVADATGINQKKAQSKRVDSTSAEDFTRLVQVESLTRSALSAEKLAGFVTGVARNQGKTFGTPSHPYKSSHASDQLVQTAVSQTRSLAQRTGSVNFARRVLVLEHTAGKPLDTVWLSGTLTKNLQGRGKSSKEIADEQQFWQGLYGATTAPTLSSTRQDDLVRSMELGLLGDKLRADITRARGAVVEADRADDQVQQTALRSHFSTIAITCAGIIAGLVGVGLTIFLIVVAVQRDWRTLKPVPSPEVAPDFGTLIDCFVFYFALLWLGRPLLSALASAILPRAEGTGNVGIALLFTTGSYVLIHALAAVYTAFTLHRRGLRLADIGFHAEHMSRNIGIGILGYCAALPTVGILGLLAKWVFQSNPDLTPNPILPMLTSSEGAAQKLLLFLLVAVAAPLFEEFFFRGVLYTGLRARFGIAASILISAALFAIGHPLHDWFPIFGLGVALASVRELRQSLIPGMTLHFLQNAGTFLSLSVLFSR